MPTAVENLRSGNGNGFINPGTLKGFNPQPDPPGDMLKKGFLSPGTLQGFNPQPEPPGDMPALLVPLIKKN